MYVTYICGVHRVHVCNMHMWCVVCMCVVCVCVWCVYVCSISMWCAYVFIICMWHWCVYVCNIYIYIYVVCGVYACMLITPNSQRLLFALGVIKLTNKQTCNRNEFVHTIWGVRTYGVWYVWCVRCLVCVCVWRCLVPPIDNAYHLHDWLHHYPQSLSVSTHTDSIQLVVW